MPRSRGHAVRRMRLSRSTAELQLAVDRWKSKRGFVRVEGGACCAAVAEELGRVTLRPCHWLPLRDSNSEPRFFLTSATYKRREVSEPGLYRNPINASDLPPRHFRPSGRPGEGFVILVSPEKPCSGPTIPARDLGWIKGGINDSKSVANMRHAIFLAAVPLIISETSAFTVIPDVQAGAICIRNVCEQY
jgi:hypothetical protein